MPGKLDGSKYCGEKSPGKSYRVYRSVMFLWTYASVFVYIDFKPRGHGRL